MRIWRGLLSILLVALAACQASSAVEKIEPQPQATQAKGSIFPTMTPTPSAEASKAPTEPAALATQEITPPAPGNALLDEPLADENWYLPQFSGSTAKLQDGLLSLALQNQSVTYEASSRLTLPDNFYLQMQIDLAACSNGDYYSIVFWKGSDLGTFVLDFNCQAQMRVRNLRDGGARVLRDWTAVRKLAPQVPSSNLIGIWAIADRVDIFANGQFQLEFDAAGNNGGGFGFSLSSTGKGLTALSLSGLGIYEP